MGHHLLHVELRFGDAVTVAGHGTGSGVAQEEQVARGEGVQHRQIDLFLLGPQPVDGGQGVEFPVVGQIEGDTFGRQDLGMLLELGNQLLGRLLLLGLGQALSALTDELAQGLSFRLGIRHGGSSDERATGRYVDRAGRRSP